MYEHCTQCRGLLCTCGGLCKGVASFPAPGGKLLERFLDDKITGDCSSGVWVGGLAWGDGCWDEAWIKNVLL